MVGQFRLQRALQDCFRELFQKAVFADDVFRLFVIGQQLVNQCLVDGHRFLILLFRWSFTQLLLHPRRSAQSGTPCSAPPIPMHASTPLILRKSRMRRRARTDLCGGRSVMVVPTATVIWEMSLISSRLSQRIEAHK